jgi:hypothetical protein
MTSQVSADQSANSLPLSWQRLLALSGVAFAGLFVVGWFTNGGLTPHYNEPNEAWTDWARDNQWNSRVSGFLMLLAGFVFLYFMGTIRSVLGGVDSPARGSEQLARVAFGGAVTGMAGMAMASVMLAAASTNGADVDPVVSKSVATASGGPFLIAAMGFAAFLTAAGLLTLRTRVFARWTGFLALVGGVCFLVTFLTVIDGTTDGSAFGYAFFPAIVSLVIWSIAASVARYRALSAATIGLEAPAALD